MTPDEEIARAKLARHHHDEMTRTYTHLKAAAAKARLDAENMRVLGAFFESIDTWAKLLSPEDRLFLRIQGIDPR